MMVARHYRRGLLIFSVSTLGFFISSFSAVLASDFPSRIVSILDGDTLEVLHNGKAERIRLTGIDCPEKGQAYGKKAKQAASELVFGVRVSHAPLGTQRAELFPAHRFEACGERALQLDKQTLVMRSRGWIQSDHASLDVGGAARNRLQHVMNKIARRPAQYEVIGCSHKLDRHPRGRVIQLHRHL